MKLTAWVNFINILRAHFSYESLLTIFFYLHVTREKLPKRLTYEKCVRKLFMKLTPEIIGETEPAKVRSCTTTSLKKVFLFWKKNNLGRTLLKDFRSGVHNWNLMAGQNFWHMQGSYCQRNKENKQNLGFCGSYKKLPRATFGRGPYVVHVCFRWSTGLWKCYKQIK